MVAKFPQPIGDGYVSQHRLVRDRASSMDYLSDRLIASFFEAREHEGYYRSLKHVNTRRDFNETIIPVLIDFIGEALSNPNTQALDAVIGAAADARRVIRPTQDFTPEARRLHPEGFKLLQIDGELTLERLKSLYRRAARKHHPDAGGSHEAMIFVNEAYNLFHELLCQPQVEILSSGRDATPSSLFDVPIETAGDFAFSIGRLLLEIKLDEWSLDDAHYWATTLAFDDWMASSYARNPRVRSDLLFPCSTLAGRLWGAGMKEKAMEIYKIAEEAQRIAVEHGTYHGGGLFEADGYIKEGQKLRVVLTHRRQADNALRVGLIDHKRHRKTIERLDGKAGLTEGHSEVLSRYVAEFGFLQDLPTDRVAKGKVVRAKLVPEPGYFDDRLDQLSDDQQAEYLQAFGTIPEIGVVRKYTNVRLASLLRMMITHGAGADFRAIERECRSLANIQTRQAGEACEQVAEIARHLGDLRLDERREKCAILRELDERACDVGSMSITLDLSSGRVSGPATDSTFRVRPDPRYAEIVFLPLGRLRLAKETGSTRTKVEEAEERAIWNRDITLINSLRDGEAYKAAWEALDRAKDDPETVVRLASAYTEKLLDRARTMVHTEHLNVGFWIDRITIALTRLKRWEDVAGWLERFFSLPERLQTGSSPSEQDSMRKRLGRCYKMLER